MESDLHQRLRDEFGKIVILPGISLLSSMIKSNTTRLCRTLLSKIPEDESLTYDEDTGLVEPFIVMYFGGPIRRRRP